ncbi:hypothetical protein CsSME_00048201 [Camellia sinensis var. sinensis]
MNSRAFFDKRISQEVSGDSLGEEFKGYVFKIMGGCDKQGFPMKQGVLTPGRVRLLLHRVGLESLLSESNDCIVMALHVFVVMEGAKESRGGNLFGGASSARTSLF